ncbi:hypothetical protein F4803DRAFT_532182 [Xylaria telfairii]|nr:hypothetical protein F4803DRAFT_532182 [Xylaria telfairii]
MPLVVYLLPLLIQSLLGPNQLTSFCFSFPANVSPQTASPSQVPGDLMLSLRNPFSQLLGQISVAGPLIMGR